MLRTSLTLLPKKIIPSSSSSCQSLTSRNQPFLVSASTRLFSSSVTKNDDDNSALSNDSTTTTTATTGDWRRNSNSTKFEARGGNGGDNGGGGRGNFNKVRQQQQQGGGWRQPPPPRQTPSPRGGGGGRGGGDGGRDRLAEFLTRHDDTIPGGGGGSGRTSWRTTSKNGGGGGRGGTGKGKGSPSNRPPPKRRNDNPTEDLRDISHLRSAFLRSVKLDRERRIASPSSSSPSPTRESAPQPPPPENESKLEKVLRESAQKRREEMERRGLFSDNSPHHHQHQQGQPFRDNNASGNGGGGGGGGWRSSNNVPRYTGTKAFRERKKERSLNHNNNNNNNRFTQRQSPTTQRSSTAAMYNRRQEEEERKRREHQKRRQRLRQLSQEEKIVTLPRKQTQITLGTLAPLFGIKISQLLKTLNEMGEEPKKGNDVNNTSEYSVDMDIAELVAMELGIQTERVENEEEGELDVVKEAERRLMRTTTAAAAEEDEEKMMAFENLPPRPPVVCIMGHVDHGKTTLMDALRRMSAQNSSLQQSGSGGNKKKGKGSSNNKKKGKNQKKNGKGKNGEIVGDMAGTEAGGITQVISAFQVALSTSLDDSTTEEAAVAVPAVTFLDTPGHAAFKSMRQSGCNATDVMVLVIAADDGISPQTVEILETYKSIVKSQPGSISLMIAMTKIDKYGVDVEESLMRIENELLEYGIMTENLAAVSSGVDEDEFYGPPVQMVPVSAITGEGLEDLVESLTLQSEVMDLRANEEERAEGIVLDARMDRGLGVVVDCIVRWGKLEKGDVVISGMNCGKVKILSDVGGNAIKKGMPSQPVRIVGFKSLPKAGDPIVCVESEEIAKDLISQREALTSMGKDTSSAGEFSSSSPSSFRAEGSSSQPELQITGMESKQAHLTQRIHERYGLTPNGENGEDPPSDAVRIPVIIKADADGTLEAVRDAILSIGTESKLDLCIDPVGLSIGPITTTDVRMASDSGAPIFVFGSVGNGDSSTMSLAESEDVTIRSHKVIYHLLDDAKDVFASFFPPVPVEKVHGSAYVQAVFDVNNKKNAERIAGLKVQDGTLYKERAESASGSGGGEKLNCYYRVLRNGDVVSDGDKLVAGSLRKVKDDVDKVKRGEDCGLGLTGFKDFEEGDIVECYSVEMTKVSV